MTIVISRPFARQWQLSSLNLTQPLVDDPKRHLFLAHFFDREREVELFAPSETRGLGTQARQTKRFLPPPLGDRTNKPSGDKIGGGQAALKRQSRGAKKPT
jgi:hypothetical protein